MVLRVKAKPIIETEATCQILVFPLVTPRLYSSILREAPDWENDAPIESTDMKTKTREPGSRIPIYQEGFQFTDAGFDLPMREK